MSEMALTADDVIVIGKGRLLAHMPMREFIVHNSRSVVRVRTADDGKLAAVLGTGHEGVEVSTADDNALLVTGMDMRDVGEAAFAAGLAVHELAAEHASLEDVFMQLTQESVEYKAGTD